jgi:glutaredoxin 3
MIVVYSKTVCPYCVQAKNLLDSKGIKYTEVNIETNAAGRDYLVEKSLRSVPQIFEGELHIGGFDKLQTWLQLKDQSL